MGRIRTIKPEFPQSESIGRLSRDARLLFLQLFTLVDDSGRTRASSRILASLLYPYDDDARGLIDGWLTELTTQNHIVRYSVDGDTFLEICNWLKHQKIDRPTPSKHPSLSDGSRVLDESSTSPHRRIKEGIKDQGLSSGAKNAPDSSEAALADQSAAVQILDGNGFFGADETEKKVREERELNAALGEVFAYYLVVMRRNRATYTFSALRRKKGMARLQEAVRMTHGNLAGAVELMKAVVDEVAQSDFHMGREPKTGGKSYCEWEDHLFRSTEQFEKWVQRYQEAVAREGSPCVK